MTKCICSVIPELIPIEAVNICLICFSETMKNSIALAYSNSVLIYCTENAYYRLTINNSKSNNYNELTKADKCRTIVTARHQRQ